MVPHRSKSLASRVAAVSAALLSWAVLGGCAQQPDTDTGSAHNAQHVVDEQPRSSDASTDAAATSTTPQHSRRVRSADPSTTVRQPVETREPGRCHTSMLEGSLKQGSPGAGQRYARLILRNDSSRSCDVYGYPGLQLVDSHGAPLPTEAERTADPTPRTVRLAPGETASARLHWTVVPTGERSCAPTPSGLRVIPPDETDQLSVDWNGRICGDGHIDVSAFR